MAGSRFQKAVRERLNLRMALDGPSGSGKSYTAQRIAMLLAQEYGTRVALIESENRSARKYIGESPDGIPFEFDDLCLSSYSPTEYTAAIEEAGAAKYGVLVIDSLSHAWTGKDGALELVDKQGKNKFTDGWKTVTPMHNRMIEAILAFKGHVIVTMRSKTDYIIEEDEKGKKVPRKVALAPIQRAGMEYEFDIYGSMDWSHVMTVTKSRCSAVDGQVVVKPGAAFVRPVISWLNTGEAEAPDDAIKVVRVSEEQLVELTRGVAAKGMNAETLKMELIRRYQVERLADLTPFQATDFMKRKLTTKGTVQAAATTAPIQGAGVTSPVGSNTPAEPPAPVDDGGDEGDEGNEGEPLTSTAIEEAAASPSRTTSLPDPNSPVGKGMLGSLNNTIEEFMNAGGKLAVVRGGIAKYGNGATDVTQLTHGQAEALEAAILKKLRGPNP